MPASSNKSELPVNQSRKASEAEEGLTKEGPADEVLEVDRSTGHRTSTRRYEPIQTPDFFEEMLPALRNHLGWTQAELGSFFGVSRASASRWENRGVGETEPRKAALRLAEDCLQVSFVPGRTVGEKLLDAGCVGVVTAGIHRNRSLSDGRLKEPVGPARITQIRDRLGWTQVALATFLGVTHSVPAVWESGNGTFGDAVHAALLALWLVTRPGQDEYPGPDQPMETVRKEGLATFYREAAGLQVQDI